MGAAPETIKVTGVRDDGKVMLENVNNPVDISPKGTPVQVGQELRGWLNLDGKYGPYFKVAEDRPQSASNGSSQAPRDDATGTSIEAQVAGKCAADVVAAQGFGDNASQSQVAERINFLTGAFFDAIQSAKGVPPATTNEIPDPPPF